MLMLAQPLLLDAIIDVAEVVTIPPGTPYL